MYLRRYHNGRTENSRSRPFGEILRSIVIDPITRMRTLRIEVEVKTEKSTMPGQLPAFRGLEII
jgi:hypothetical protein